MQVETFECQEVASEPIEASEEAISLIRELGLHGQASLIGDNQKSGRQDRIPYRIITSEEAFVYRTLCPKQTHISKYADASMPLRVLQIAAHAKSLGLIHLYVWHRATPAIKDPVLIARVDDYDWSSDDSKTRILVRWGEELETFAVLTKRAVEAAKQRLLDEAESLLNKVKCLSTGELIDKGAGVSITF